MIFSMLVSFSTIYFTGCKDPGKEQFYSTSTTATNTGNQSDDETNSEELETYVPGSTINILFLYTKQAVDDFVVACTTATCDYQDQDVLDELKSKAQGYIETLNEGLQNSGVTHRASLADPFPNDPTRSIAIIDTSEQDIISITASDPNFQYPDSKCDQRNKVSPTRDAAGIDYNDHWWPCKAHEWMYGSQNSAGEIFTLRNNSQADAIVLLTTSYDPYPPNLPEKDDDGNLITGIECFATGTSSHKRGLADQQCEDEYGGDGYQCILDEEWGGVRATLDEDEENIPGRCYGRFYSGGAVTQVAKGTEFIEADAPFISLEYTHGGVPHELGHLLGLAHDKYDSAGINNGLIYHGYVDTSVTGIPNSDYGGIRDMMSYNGQCTGKCNQVPVFGNPHYIFPYTTNSGENLGAKMGELTQSFGACTFEEMGYYASQFFENSNLGTPSNYFTVSRSASNCSIPAGVLNKIYQSCSGQTAHWSNDLGKFFGCTFVDSDITVQENVTILDGNLSNGSINAPHFSIRNIAGNLTLNIGEHFGTPDQYMYDQGFTNNSTELNFPMLEGVVGSITINVDSLSSVSKIAFPSLENATSITINSPYNVNCDFTSLNTNVVINETNNGGCTP